MSQNSDDVSGDSAPLDDSRPVLEAPNKRRRRSRHRRKSMLKRRVKFVLLCVFLSVSVLLIAKGLTMVLGDYEERRNIFATRADCEVDYPRAKCTHVTHNDLWYGPWYRVPIGQPSMGPDSADPKFRNNRVLNVERRDPKKGLLSR